MKLYPVADHVPFNEGKALGAPVLNGFMLKGNLRAIKTREKRCPKRGEWFLSGAIAEAYKAPNDLSQEYHIAKLVRIEQVITERIVTQ